MAAYIFGKGTEAAGGDLGKVAGAVDPTAAPHLRNEPVDQSHCVRVAVAKAPLTDP